MLYCQPQDFYDEMLFVSNNNDSFIKKIDLSYFKVLDDIENIDPVSYIIQMALNEPISDEPNKIFALRTYGTFNALKVKSTDKVMKVYFATISNGSLYISYPSISFLAFKNDVMYFIDNDEFGDEFWFTIQDIANSTCHYSKFAYVNYHSDIFKPTNLLAKIPVNLLTNLV